MKRIKLAIIITCILCTMVLLPVSANDYDPKNRYSIYTMKGEIYTKYNGSKLSMIACPGSLVYASARTFDRLLHTNVGTSYLDVYSCFGNDSENESLTLGFNVNEDYWNVRDDIITLKAKVVSHINYINSIGGVMTGYEFGYESMNKYDPYVNISWNVGDEHHYARFENAIGHRTPIGYYDLMYKDGSLVQEDIPYMNETFSVPWENV